MSRQQSLEDYFDNIPVIKDRNKKIKEAVLGGYKQRIFKAIKDSISKIYR